MCDSGKSKLLQCISQGHYLGLQASWCESWCYLHATLVVIPPNKAICSFLVPVKVALSSSISSSLSTSCWWTSWEHLNIKCLRSPCGQTPFAPRWQVAPATWCLRSSTSLMQGGDQNPTSSTPPTSSTLPLAYRSGSSHPEEPKRNIAATQPTPRFFWISTSCKPQSALKILIYDLFKITNDKNLRPNLFVFVS